MVGISNATVYVADSLVSFDCQNKADIPQVEKALQSLGYPKMDAHNPFTTKAKSFLSCGIGRMTH